MKTLYLECYSGISGDMAVAALLDLGADEAVLRDGLDSLGVSGLDIGISRVIKNGVLARDFNVFLLGHDGGHRGLPEIEDIIDGSKITDNAKRLSKKMFRIVAEAEAKIHGLPVTEVHFHEIGAADSIADIVGAAICADNLGITKAICTPLSEGCGTIKCRHGVIPVPAPATLEIAATYKIPLLITQTQGELVTPTGIAIAAALCDGNFNGAPGAVTVLKTGYGAGKKEYETANVLRASIVASSPGHGEVLELSCNIDDMTGEQLAYACEVIMRNGALDCWLTPILMKKGRPAHMLSLLTTPDRGEEFARLLFRHTSTAGVRGRECGRFTMERSSRRIGTVYGELTIKEFSSGDICKSAVEYESAKKLADDLDKPINEIFHAGGSF